MRKILTLILLAFLIYGCQLNDSLKKIVDIGKMNTNTVQAGKDSPKKTSEPAKKKVTKGTTFEENSKNIKQGNFDEGATFNFKDERVVLIQPKVKREIIETEVIKEIALLLPLSGKNSLLGQTIINSIRLYLLDNSTDLSFKVFDTKSSSSGVKIAFQKALNENLKIFIGPIFSQETLFIRDYASKNDVQVFSLSTDKNAASENIVISGLSLEEEILCITRKAENQGLKKFGLIFSSDNYGILLKKTLGELIADDKNSTINYLNLKEENNLDEAIKRFSYFNLRKEKLDKEIEKISNSELDRIEKEKILEELSKKETYGSQPYDIIVVGEGGNKLVEILALLSYYDIDSTNTDIVGTSIWEGLEKYQEDLLDKTFYSTSLNVNKKKYKRKFNSYFQKDPINLNYVVNDVLILLEKNYFEASKILNIKGKINVADSEYVTISEKGYLSREVNIYQNIKGELKSVFQCPISLF
tara:strand:- start:708 stop:2120 length:1413 start_codon:yes stop_codon:yes gene_type:complete